MQQQPTSPITPPPMPQQALVPPPQYPQKKSRLWLWITLAITGFLAVIAIVVTIVILSNNPVNTATSYLKAVQDNDEAAMKRLSTDGKNELTDSVHDRLQGAEFTVSGEEKRQESTIVTFSVSKSEKLKKIMVTVKDNTVTGMSYTGGSSIGADNGSSKKKDSDTSPTPTKTAAKCLTSADFRRSGYTHVKDGYFVLENGKFDFRSIFFKPDSTAYEYETSNVEMAKLGLLYKFNTDKQFSIELVGQTYEANKSSEGTKLALERANRIKRELISQGIPEDRIVVSEPTIANHDSSDNTADRHVRIYIVAPQTCSEK